MSEDKGTASAAWCDPEPAAPGMQVPLLVQVHLEDARELLAHLCAQVEAYGDDIGLESGRWPVLHRAARVAVQVRRATGDTRQVHEAPLHDAVRWLCAQGLVTPRTPRERGEPQPPMHIEFCAPLARDGMLDLPTLTDTPPTPLLAGMPLLESYSRTGTREPARLTFTESARHGTRCGCSDSSGRHRRADVLRPAVVRVRLGVVAVGHRLPAGGVRASRCLHRGGRQRLMDEFTFRIIALLLLCGINVGVWCIFAVVMARGK